jgi:hypothetical protein
LSTHEEARKVPIDENSFMRYYQTAIRAASMEGPPPLTKDRMIPRTDETAASVLELVFGDTPLSRMTIALKNRMAEEGQAGALASALMRILSLIRLIGDGSLKHRAISGPRDPKHLYYPDAVVYAAAVAPLDDNGTFPIDEFDRLVEDRMGGMNCGNITAPAWAECISGGEFERD